MRTKQEDDEVITRLLDQQTTEIESLRAQNKELLEALKMLQAEILACDKLAYPEWPPRFRSEGMKKADSAIRRAEEKK